MFVIHPLWARLAGSGLFFALFVLFLNPCFLGIRNIGNMAGMAVCIIGFLFFAANPAIAAILQKIWQHSIGHIIMCILLGCLAAGSVFAFTISGCMLYQMNNAPHTENTVVVLGCQVKNGGPSLMLRRRLDAALTYLNAHPDVPVIVCGGQGHDEAISEAQCMYEYLTAKGIAPERITQEDRSTSTIENLQNAKEILHEQGRDTRITLVTDGFHQLRASMIADSIAIETDHVSARTPWYLVPTYWVREWFGICYQLLLA